MAISPNTSPLWAPAQPLEPQMTHITWLVTLAAVGLLCSPFTARWSSGSHSYPTIHGSSSASSPVRAYLLTPVLLWFILGLDTLDSTICSRVVLTSEGFWTKNFRVQKEALSPHACMERSQASQVTAKLRPGRHPPFTTKPSAADSFFILSAGAAVASDSAYPKSTNLEVWPRQI